MTEEAFGLKAIVEGIESFSEVTYVDGFPFENIFDETRAVFFEQHNILIAPKAPVYSTSGLNRILLELEEGLGPDYIVPCRINNRAMVYGKLYFAMQPDKGVEHYQYGVVTLIPNASLGSGIRRKVSNGWYIALNKLDLKELRRMKLADLALRKH